MQYTHTAYTRLAVQAVKPVMFPVKHHLHVRDSRTDHTAHGKVQQEPDHQLFARGLRRAEHVTAC